MSMPEKRHGVNRLWENAPVRSFTILSLFLMLALPEAMADDGAASIAAGGLVVMKREPRIVMAKEILRIAPNKVRVDYEFRNDSNEDITTTVAFPIAPYSWEDYFSAHEEAFNEVGSKPSVSRIASFRLWVEGKPTHYQVAARAMLRGRDYGSMLRSVQVDPATFGHLPEGGGEDDFRHLGAKDRYRLAHLGLLSENTSATPQWKVELKYHWKQRFPAHAVVHIRHEYAPITGQLQTPPDYLPGTRVPPGEEDTARDIRRILNSTCLPPQAAKAIGKVIADHPNHKKLENMPDTSVKEYFSHMLVMDYVDFILTTANTWKQPIENFTLLLERNPYRNEKAADVYFCSNGPLSGADGTTTSFHTSNFTPVRELRVGFFRYR